MRIIAGRLKGRRLRGPAGSGVRPTSDGLRETLFNVLGPTVDGLRVLDAFAGTGALGLEALSRGAIAVTFVERDRREVRVLEANVAACGVQEACAIIRDDFLVFAARVTGRDHFDLVLLDPPYEATDLHAVLAAAAPLVAPAGQLVIEHSRRRVVPESIDALARTRLLVAGDSALAWYAHG
jgi:16S rRNA (guanine966-N2)-methyltransferase